MRSIKKRVIPSGTPHRKRCNWKPKCGPGISRRDSRRGWDESPSTGRRTRWQQGRMFYAWRQAHNSNSCESPSTGRRTRWQQGRKFYAWRHTFILLLLNVALFIFFGKPSTVVIRKIRKNKATCVIYTVKQWHHLWKISI